jgi:hypothetical protein
VGQAAARVSAASLGARHTDSIRTHLNHVVHTCDDSVASAVQIYESGKGLQGLLGPLRSPVMDGQLYMHVGLKSKWVTAEGRLGGL